MTHPKIDHHTRSELDRLFFRMTHVRFEYIFSEHIYAFSIHGGLLDLVTTYTGTRYDWHCERAKILNHTPFDVPEGFCRIIVPVASEMIYMYIKVGSFFRISRNHNGQRTFSFEHSFFTFTLPERYFQYLQNKIEGKKIIFEPNTKIKKKEF